MFQLRGTPPGMAGPVPYGTRAIFEVASDASDGGRLRDRLMSGARAGTAAFLMRGISNLSVCERLSENVEG